MKKWLIFIAAITVVGLSSGCATLPNPTAPLHERSGYYNYIQDDFESYVDETRHWLTHNREFVSGDHGKELDMNAPFILHPSEPSNKAAFLVHGLGDSPYSFSDIAKSLQSQGFHVYVLLLPGHGSKPADLMMPSYEDWQLIVDHYAEVLKGQFDKVWLGGFSTGANLVTINTIERSNTSGLLLFSPGFETHSPFVEKLAPFIAQFTDWGWRVEEDNIARYRSSPVNASIAYSNSALRVRELLEEAVVDVPTIIVMSEADSVINPVKIKEYFHNNFKHPASQMLWYGNDDVSDKEPSDAGVLVLSMDLPELHISTGSHMSPLFAPDNPYYGAKGEKKMCSNSMSWWKISRCERGDEVWFSAWGYSESGKIFARLTWNPYYEHLENTMRRVISIQ